MPDALADGTQVRLCERDDQHEENDWQADHDVVGKARDRNQQPLDVPRQERTRQFLRQNESEEWRAHLGKARVLRQIIARLLGSEPKALAQPLQSAARDAESRLTLVCRSESRAFDLLAEFDEAAIDAARLAL